MSDSVVQRFVDSFQEVDDCLTEVMRENRTIQMSLKQLSKLHHL